MAVHSAFRNCENDPELTAFLAYGISQDNTLSDVATIAFFDGDYQQLVMEYKDGKKEPPKEKPKKRETEELYEETGRALTDRIKQKELEQAQQEISQMANDAKQKRMQAAEQKLAERQTAQQTAPAE